MMGRRAGGQGQFFYAFDLDKVVLRDHLVRQIDAVVGSVLRLRCELPIDNRAGIILDAEGARATAAD
jgi:hypothetical protein